MVFVTGSVVNTQLVVTLAVVTLAVVTFAARTVCVAGETEEPLALPVWVA
jgi:hypothetical protein